MRCALIVGFLSLASLPFLQACEENDGQDHPQPAEAVKTGSPTVHVGQPRAEPTAGNRADVDARLMKGERPRARALAVVIAGERQAGREVERLAGSLQSPNGDELPQFGTPSGGDRHKAPKQAAAEDDVLATKAVTDKSRQRRSAGVNNHEGRSDEAKL